MRPAPVRHIGNGPCVRWQAKMRFASAAKALISRPHRARSCSAEKANSAVKTLRAFFGCRAGENVSMSTTTHGTELECLVLSAPEVAKVLGISERHLWACHASGRLGPRPIALGRSKRWRVAEVRDWLAAGAPARDEWDRMRKQHPLSIGGSHIFPERQHGD